MDLNYYTDSLNVRREKERGVIKKLDSTKIFTSEKWYLMPTVWLKKWHDFISGNRGLPGTIDMIALLQIPYPRKAKDYRGVNKRVWDYFVGRYRVYGEPVIRDTIHLENRAERIRNKLNEIIDDFRAFDGYLTRKIKEKTQVEELEKMDLPRKWIIPKLWLYEWENFIKRGGPIPGKIDLRGLSTNLGIAKKGVDFWIINDKLWDFYSTTYGFLGDPLSHPNPSYCLMEQDHVFNVSVDGGTVAPLESQEKLNNVPPGKADKDSNVSDYYAGIGSLSFSSNMSTEPPPEYQREEEIVIEEKWVNKHACCVITTGSLLCYLYCMAIIFSFIAGCHGATLIRDHPDNDDDDREWGWKLVKGSFICMGVLNTFTLFYNIHAIAQTCKRCSCFPDGGVCVGCKYYTNRRCCSCGYSNNPDLTRGQNRCFRCLGCTRSTLTLYYWFFASILITVISIIAWSYFVTRSEFNVQLVFALLLLAHFLALSGIIGFYYVSMCNCCVGEQKEKIRTEGSWWNKELVSIPSCKNKRKGGDVEVASGNVEPIKLPIEDPNATPKPKNPEKTDEIDYSYYSDLTDGKPAKKPAREESSHFTGSYYSDE